MCSLSLPPRKDGGTENADLPVERIVPDLPAFTNVGVDYFGQVEVKKGRGRLLRPLYLHGE